VTKGVIETVWEVVDGLKTATRYCPGGEQQFCTVGSGPTFWVMYVVSDAAEKHARLVREFPKAKYREFPEEDPTRVVTVTGSKGLGTVYPNNP